jgi:hypothetical protein
MTASITVQVPDSINNWTPLLATFFTGMIAKLDKNAHKDTPTKESLPGIMDLLLEEISEFEEQIRADRFNDNSYVELMDQANFAFLAYVALRMEHERATSERTG